MKKIQYEVHLSGQVGRVLDIRDDKVTVAFYDTSDELYIRVYDLSFIKKHMKERKDGKRKRETISIVISHADVFRRVFQLEGHSLRAKVRESAIRSGCDLSEIEMALDEVLGKEPNEMIS